MEQLKAMYPVCTLIKSDGTRCGSPALTGMNFCFHHIGGKIATPKPETRRTNTPLNFIYPGSHEAIQHNLFLVVQALSEGKIDNATAITYNRLFRSAQLNLHRWQKSKLTHGEVEPQMMPCAEPATNAGAPHLEETCDNSLPSSSSGAGAPHLAVFEMWDGAKPGSPTRAPFACWGGKREIVDPRSELLSSPSQPSTDELSSQPESAPADGMERRAFPQSRVGARRESEAAESSDQRSGLDDTSVSSA